MNLDRNYTKESNKTKPSGIRFNKEQLDFIQKKDIRLTTKQKVVDFLLNKFFIENNQFANKSISTKENAVTFGKKATVKKTPAYWVELRRACENAGDYANWLEDLEKDTFLTIREKDQIKQTI